MNVKKITNEQLVAHFIGTQKNLYFEQFGMHNEEI